MKHIKNTLILLNIFITITLSFFLKITFRLYRMFVFIDEKSTSTEINRFNDISKLQNITWILVLSILVILILLLFTEHIKKIKNLY
ncbi:hypothetical protein JOC73_001561 [Alkaliphilus hydrothermalis]|uniref:Uncharacterized protein n=1 Tax=Alkaliphilus hydrothermalis TaxID=1482730 RepID=A0ABS2NPX5_9FIRM|nr:hypothetical protein [Alkaliphilus hydrothermalis]